MRRVLLCLVLGVLLLLASTQSRAEPVLGAATALLRVEPRSSRWLTEVYIGDRPAQVTVVSDAPIQVEIHVYDSTGQQVVQASTTRSCKFLPQRTQSYRIEIRNLRALEARVVIMTH